MLINNDSGVKFIDKTPVLKSDTFVSEEYQVAVIDNIEMYLEADNRSQLIDNAEKELEAIN